MTGPSLRDAVKYYGVKLTDSLYQASVVSVLAFSGSMLMCAVVAAAVATGAVGVPEFHPK
ncbi:hypothetical protein ACNHKD_13230 [Methylocystis sp. JAN1]|uniref:hypothetical protein n=1 Tax=Methylocystis sp. JAN1 TaxID=3397211 RepID=UPI003FA2F6FD